MMTNPGGIYASMHSEKVIGECVEMFHMGMLIFRLMIRISLKFFCHFQRL